MQAEKRTDRHRDTLIAIFHTPAGDEVIVVSELWPFNHGHSDTSNII